MGRAEIKGPEKCLVVKNGREVIPSPGAKHIPPVTGKKAHQIQEYGHLILMPIALNESVRQQGVDNLNQLLADTMTLRDMYKKHHWQVSGPTFYRSEERRVGKECRS